MTFLKYPKENYFVADFETTCAAQSRLEGSARVWLYNIRNIFTGHYTEGVSIDDFFDEVFEHDFKDRMICYFHNLSFDGLFILDALEDSEKYERSSIVDGFNNIYRINVKNNKKRKVTCEFRCSYKLLSCKAEELPHAEDAGKLSIDHDEFRYHKTLKELKEQDPKAIEYCRRDTELVANTMRELIHIFRDNLTIGSTAYKALRDSIPNFDFIYPNVSLYDDMIRPAYKGGVVMLNKAYERVLIEEPVITFDVNSLYPWAMRECLLPYGEPLTKGVQFCHPAYDLKILPLIIYKMKLKENFHPCYSPDINVGMFGKNTAEYITENDKVLCVSMTSVDLETYSKYYDIDYSVDWDNALAFKSKRFAFKEFIDYWTAVKVKATIDGDPFMRMIAKLMLNSVYGKFGSKRQRVNRVLTFGDKPGKVDTLIETYQDFYLPVACFITSYARQKLLKAIQDEAEAFVYADTDSVHLIKRLYKGTIETHPTNIGMWDDEGTSIKTMFIANKQYLKQYEVDGPIKAKLASMNVSQHHRVNFENVVEPGYSFVDGKIMRYRFKGGCILVKCPFKFRFDEVKDGKNT